MFKRLMQVLVISISSSALAVPPWLSDVTDQNIPVNSTTGTLYFVAADEETPPPLSLTVTSSNTTLVPNNAAAISMGGNNSQRTLVVTPAAGQTGTTIITLTATDGEALTASSTFTLTVTEPNTKPTLENLPRFQIIQPGQNGPRVFFTIGDAETAADALTVTATSANTALVPNDHLVLGGSGPARSLQITPLHGQTGIAVIKVRITDPQGASVQGEFIFSVFDSASANNAIPQPRGLFVLDSPAGTQVNGVPMRDANVRDLPFLDGYVLRTGWPTLEPQAGVFDFAIIDNIFSKLPAQQKLSLIIASSTLPSWLTALPGVTTWTAGSPPVTRPLPWDSVTQERSRLLLVELGNHLVEGVPLRDHPRLAAINVWIPGLHSGIREPERRIRDMPGYSRSNMETAVLTHLANVTDNFPHTPTQIGFWGYVDGQDASFGGVTPWEQLRQTILSVFNGSTRSRLGFWMENLAASRPAAETDPWTGLPNTSFGAPLHLSQDRAFIGLQMLGSWSRPFDPLHVDKNLNGTPEDGMDFGFNTFQARYFEVYREDVDFADYEDEWPRWHDFLAALPGPPISLTVSSSQGGSLLSAPCGVNVEVILSAEGGSGPYFWWIANGSLPAGLRLSNEGVLSGRVEQAGSHTFSVFVTDATGGSAMQTYTLNIGAPLTGILDRVILTGNADGSITLDWSTSPGFWYQVEVSDNLIQWTKLEARSASGQAMCWTDDGTQTGSHPSTAARRFFRLRSWADE